MDNNFVSPLEKWLDFSSHLSGGHRRPVVYKLEGHGHYCRFLKIMVGTNGQKFRFYNNLKITGGGEHVTLVSIPSDAFCGEACFSVLHESLFLYT